MWAWGRNDYGEIGNNTIIIRSSPVQIGALTTWSKIDGATDHTVALKTDGTLWTWGRNGTYGQLGDNTILNRSSPVQVGSLTTWSLITCGGSFSAAIETNGTWYSWGQNSQGQIGNNTVITRSSPVQVGFAAAAETTNWRRLSSSIGNQFYAITAD